MHKIVHRSCSQNMIMCTQKHDFPTEHAHINPNLPSNVSCWYLFTECLIRSQLVYTNRLGAAKAAMPLSKPYDELVHCCIYASELRLSVGPVAGFSQSQRVSHCGHISKLGLRTRKVRLYCPANVSLRVVIGWTAAWTVVGNPTSCP